METTPAGPVGEYAQSALGRERMFEYGSMRWHTPVVILRLNYAVELRYGVLVDIILGILGGVVGGWLFGMLGIWPGGGMIGAIIVAFVGAVILVGITRLIKRA